MTVAIHLVPRDFINNNQSVTDTRRFDAFGMLAETAGSNPTPFGFVGGEQYQTDSDSGLILLGERYYDNTTGRFISRDPAYAGDNWYAYCDNDPLDATDEDGLELSYDKSVTAGQRKAVNGAIGKIRQIAKGGGKITKGQQNAAKQIIGIIDHKRKPGDGKDYIPNIKVAPAKPGGANEGNYEGDPETWVIHLTFGSLPPINLKGGGTGTATMPGLIAHEVGHVVIDQGCGNSSGMSGENGVIIKYEDPIEEGTHTPPRAPWTAGTYPG